MTTSTEIHFYDAEFTSSTDFTLSITAIGLTQCISKQFTQLHAIEASCGYSARLGGARLKSIFSITNYRNGTQQLETIMKLN